MITVLVGHRGVGKSSLLTRLKTYFGEEIIDYFDLDQEIEKHSGKTIREIFVTEGEETFRDFEQIVFKKLITGANKETYISVGAGFNTDQIPQHGSRKIRVVWVMRAADEHGRIFLNRPRLNPELSPLEEFSVRKKERDVRFRRAMWECWTMPEGDYSYDGTEALWWTGELNNVRGVLTILPEVVRSRDIFENYIQRRLKWGFDYFEIRDDLLTEQQIALVCEKIPSNKLLYAVRPSSLQVNPSRALDFEMWDWAIELGPCPYAQPPILSLHERGNWPLQDLLESFSQNLSSHLKLAIEVRSFDELKVCHEWQQQEPLNRSFLPRSGSAHIGRWAWYRLWQKQKQKLNFVREGVGSAADQPTLHEWFRSRSEVDKFAAVLGTPVDHSYSPYEHLEFVQNRKMSFFAIDIQKSEWMSAIEFLKELGLKFAAVTSPLKENAYRLSNKRSELVEKLESANTLVFNGVEIVSENTDYAGLEALKKSVDEYEGQFASFEAPDGASDSGDDRTRAHTNAGKSIAIWGGRGTLEALYQILPHAVAYSSTTGQIRTDQHLNSEPPEILVWAAPRGDQMKWPDEIYPHWKPKLILDLNYREDSAGREYAERVHAQYISGLSMFKIQARAQREFWKRY